MTIGGPKRRKGPRNVDEARRWHFARALDDGQLCTDIDVRDVDVWSYKHCSGRYARENPDMTKKTCTMGVPAYIARM